MEAIFVFSKCQTGSLTKGTEDLEEQASLGACIFCMQEVYISTFVETWLRFEVLKRANKGAEEYGRFLSF